MSNFHVSEPINPTHLLEGVVYPGDTVLLHSEQEARGHLRLRGSGIEKGWGCMGEEPLGHEVIRLDNLVDVVLVDTNRHAHDHMLRPLHHLAVCLEQVGPFSRGSSKDTSNTTRRHRTRK